jgi:hypothetical protein
VGWNTGSLGFSCHAPSLRGLKACGFAVHGPRGEVCGLELRTQGIENGEIWGGKRARATEMSELKAAHPDLPPPLGLVSDPKGKALT